MPVSSKILGGFAAAILLAGCAQQQQAPAPIAPQPIYDKLGSVIGCEGDGILNPNSETYENPCEQPPDECEPTVGASNYPCLPDEGDDQSRDPQDPTGGNTVG